MAKRTVHIDRAVWVRETFEIEISDEDLQRAENLSDARRELRGRILAACGPDNRISGDEEIGSVGGFDPAILVSVGHLKWTGV